MSRLLARRFFPLPPGQDDARARTDRRRHIQVRSHSYQITIQINNQNIFPDVSSMST